MSSGKRGSGQDGDTPGWEPEVEELRARRSWAEAMGGPDAVERHHVRGRLTVRERIDNLADTGTFLEVGKLAGDGEYENGEIKRVTPAPYVMGLAKIDGRSVAVGGEDFTVRGGTSWSGDRRKGGQGGFVEDLALDYRIPLVNLIDGAGGTVSGARKRGHTVFPGVHGFETSVDLLARVPVASAIMGSAAGGPAGRAILSHWSVMTRETSQIFAAGPPVVQRSLGEKIDKHDLGGAEVAADASGTVDNVAEDEAEALQMVRRFLSYMPQNVWELPPREDTGDDPARRDEELLSIVPRDRRRPYSMHRIIELLADSGSVFEIKPRHGKAVISALARFHGYPVGIIANNPRIYGGAMDVNAARKQEHFIELCDQFHLPIVFLVDVPGFMVGSRAEAAGTLRAGMRALYVGAQATVPVFTVVIRKCYGMAGMATCNKNGIDLKVAWPSAEWGSLPVEGGAAAAYRREIEAADDPEGREREIIDELRALSSPFRTAEAFGVEDIIDPRETRSYLCRFIEAAQGKLRGCLGVKSKAGVRP